MKMISTGIDGLLGALVAALSAIPPIYAFWRWNSSRTKKKSVERWKRATTGARDIDRELRVIQRELGAQRVLLVASHNGGGLPRAGSPAFISITAEVTDGTVPPIADRFNPYPVDADYRDQVLIPVLAHNSFWLPTTNIHSSWLRVLNEATGVSTTKYRLISAEPKTLLFVVVNFITEREGLTAAEHNVINEACEHVAKIVNGEE